MAQIAPPFGDLVHTLIDRSNYAGFLPSFLRQHEPTSTATPTATPTATSTATSTSTGITHIDHIAIAFEKGIATRACEWYCKAFGRANSIFIIE
jgi:4-hydroxyphenylpyruvate dioxygenase-like putative hemolysin